MQIQTIAEEDGAGHVTLPDGPPEVEETLALYIVDYYYCKMVIIHFLNSVDNFFIKSFCSQYLKNSGEYHQIKSCHLVIVKDS